MNTSSNLHTARKSSADKTLNNKRKYVPDISAFMSLCDANYAKLMQLLPEFENKDERVFGLARNKHELGKIRIRITERCKYTTTMLMTQDVDSDFIDSTHMEVRVYHDAAMAEVLSFQGIGKLKGNYAYPNEHMLQQDEKILCNEFLADWLSYCLKFGYSFEI